MASWCVWLGFVLVSGPSESTGSPRPSSITTAYPRLLWCPTRGIEDASSLAYRGAWFQPWIACFILSLLTGHDICWKPMMDIFLIYTVWKHKYDLMLESILIIQKKKTLPLSHFILSQSSPGFLIKDIPIHSKIKFWMLCYLSLLLKFGKQL